jgi:hypothetical protein
MCHPRDPTDKIQGARPPSPCHPAIPMTDSKVQQRTSLVIPTGAPERSDCLVCQDRGMIGCGKDADGSAWKTQSVFHFSPTLGLRVC